MKWYAVIFIAIIIEAVVAYLRTIIVDRKIQWQTILAIALGVTAALVWKIDILSIAEVTAASVLGEILTGILLSRGSDYIVEFIELISGENVTIATR